MDLLRRGAENGLGIAFLSRIVVFDALASGELVQVLPEISQERTYHIVYKERNPPRRVRAVLEFLLGFVGAGWFPGD